MRAALQFLMRHMVKRAVMRSPIKRALGLADLERAQAMIYKLVVNGLLEEPSAGKAKPGENTVLLLFGMITEHPLVRLSLKQTSLKSSRSEK